MVGEAIRARVATSSGAGPSEAAGAPGSGKPRAKLNLAPRCGAKTRVGCACRAPAMANRRCWIHGGTSSGPRMAAGSANLAAARTTSGDYSAPSWASDRYRRTLAVRLRLLVATRQLRAFLPPDVAARLVAVPAELSAPVHYSQIAKPEIATKILRSGGRDAPGRFTASAREAPRGARGGAGGGASGPGCIGAVAGSDRRGEAGQTGGAGGSSGGSNRKPRQRPNGAAGGRLPWGSRGGDPAQVGGRGRRRAWRWRGRCVGLGMAGCSRSGGARREADTGLAKSRNDPRVKRPRAWPVRRRLVAGEVVKGRMWAARPLLSSLRVTTPGSKCHTGSSARRQALAGCSGASLAPLLVVQAREGREGCVAKGVPALAKSGNGDKDSVDPRTMRWP
jgi:hypothetical protein